MKKYFAALMATLCFVSGSNTVLAADNSKGTSAQATAMVEKAIAHIKKAGRDKAFADFSDAKGAFVDRDLYVVVYDLKGKVLAHGANAKMIGKDVIDLRDVDGKLFVKERVEMMSKSPTAKGWQEYKFMNPVTKQIEPKAMFLQRHEDVMVGCGIYK